MAGCAWSGLLLVLSGACCPAHAQPPEQPPVLVLPATEPDPFRPAPDDDSAEALRRYQDAFRARYGDDRDVPLDVKAEHFEWLLERYLWAPYDVVHHTVTLPDAPDGEREYLFGDDVATWNGPLLAALSYKYAVTGDRQTLARIERLLRGLHFLQTVTGQPGLIARCALRRDTPIHTATLRHVAEDGTVYYVRSDAAKGTYNQVVHGYSVMMLLAWHDLPADVQALARRDLQELVHHLVEHDYRLTERDGRRTTYGDLTPIVATVGVPFNAQLAYAIVSAGHHFPGDDASRAKRIRRAYARLREKHHVYYESPLTHLIRPQEVGASPFVKGMNDRNHVLNAAYIGLLIELEHTRRHNKEPDPEFLFQLGQTMVFTMAFLDHQLNGLCNFMWAGILSDPQAFAAIVPHDRGRTVQQLDRLVSIGVEQLRRFPVDRFARHGEKILTRAPQWVDARKRSDSYLWKSGPFYRIEETGPPTNHLCASIDYLHAYWLMRYWRLDERHPVR